MPGQKSNSRDISCHLRTVFELNPYLSRYSWEIETTPREIRLMATVHHPAIAALAEAIATELYGRERRVDNRVVVDPAQEVRNGGPSLFQRMEDLNTLTSIRIKYDLNQYTHHSSIDLKVSSRYAILSGAVKDKLTRYYAGELAYDTIGVDRLLNQLVVDPDRAGVREPPSAACQASPVANLKIMLVLSRRFSSLPLQISQDGDIVSLVGEVGDELTRKRLENIASAVLGIGKVRTGRVITKKPG